MCLSVVVNLRKQSSPCLSNTGPTTTSSSGHDNSSGKSVFFCSSDIMAETKRWIATNPIKLYTKPFHFNVFDLKSSKFAMVDNVKCDPKILRMRWIKDVEAWQETLKSMNFHYLVSTRQYYPHGWTWEIISPWKAQEEASKPCRETALEKQMHTTALCWAGTGEMAWLLCRSAKLPIPTPGHLSFPPWSSLAMT